MQNLIHLPDELAGVLPSIAINSNQRISLTCRTSRQGSRHAKLVAVQDGSFSFVVIQKVPECDDDLQDSLASLNFSIASDSDLDLA